MDDLKFVVGIIAAMIFLSVVAIFGCCVAVDYWNGTARAAIIERQTGIKYTWREAAQIKTMYD